MKKLMKRFKKDEQGLTLVELLAVVVILGIVGTIAFVMIGNIIENSKKDAHVANAQQLVSAAKLYEANHGEIPEAGVSTGTDGSLDDYIEKLINPWSKKSEDDYKGTVKKVDEVYRVTMEGDDGCVITNAPESEILQGRDAVCGKTFTE